MQLALEIILLISSVLMVMFVLLHKGKGGGLSSLFGGGVQSNLSGSTVVEKNLDRLTIICAIIWIGTILGLSALHFV
ncbi:MAG: preprotein translocase subunit SecG [Corynebacterium sp.]|nr:preprotein translocase subunit SecG [Corynebacterium sp.]